MSKRKKSVTIYLTDSEYKKMQDAYALHIKNNFLSWQEFNRLCLIFARNQVSK